jgi:uncharacterized membrane protein (DUF441 family)
MEMRQDPVKSTMVSWRRWALYGAVIAAAYTGVDTYADLSTKPFALYAGKLIGSIIAGALLGGVASLVRNRYSRGGNVAANTDSAA